MPIRFRCAYCNQLMAISRRKAGTVVSCPKCAGDIIVPTPDATASHQANTDQPNQAFDEMDFDALLEQPANLAPTVNAPDEASANSRKEPVSESNPPIPSIQRRGIFIPFRGLLIGCFLEVLLLVVVFVIGLIVGWKAP